MKHKSVQTVLVCTLVCFLLFNAGLLILRQMDKNELFRLNHRLEHLENVEFMFEASKETIVTGFKYEQHSIGNALLYSGSDSKTLFHAGSVADRPRQVLGLNQNMCRPCVEGIFADIKEFFPDFETNPNIICIAGIEQRFKDDYYGKKVVSFHKKEDFSLYEIAGTPYFFILDKDLCVKLLFITDNTSPELTKEYLKIIKERYPDI